MNAQTKATSGPWFMSGNLIKCNAGYNIGSVNSHKTTEGEANAELIIKAVNEWEALNAIVAAAETVSNILDLNRSAMSQNGGDSLDKALNQLYTLRKSLNQQEKR